MSGLLGRKERMHNFTTLSRKLSDFAGYFTRGPIFPSEYYNKVCIYLIYTVQDLINEKLADQFQSCSKRFKSLNSNIDC